MAAPTTVLNADPTSIREGGPSGNFILDVTDSEFPCSATSVSVSVRVGGSATQGVDYRLSGLSGDSVTVPMTLIDTGTCDGNFGFTSASGSATVLVDALTDTQSEGDETVTLASTTCQVEGATQTPTPCVASTAMTIVDATPIATIEASDPNASKDPIDPGELRVTLSEPAPNGGVSIQYSVTGSASPGVDYDRLAGILLIPAGQSTATITVTPLNSGGSTDSTTVIVTLNSGSGYSVGTPASAQVTIGGLALGLSSAQGNGQVVTSGEALAPFVVQVTGASGSGLAGLVVLWSIERGDGSLSTTRSVTDATGQTSATLTPGNESDYTVRATLEINGSSTEFSALAAPLSSLPGLSDAQRSMAAAVESLCPKLGAIGQERVLTSGESDLLDQCSALIATSTSNPAAATQGIVALTPEQASAPRKLTTQISSVQLDNLTSRLAALRRGARGISLGGLRVGFGDQSVSGSQLAALIDQIGASGGGASADDPYPFERLGFFVTGDLQWGNKDRSANEDGFDFDTAGITAGMDYRFDSGLILGGALGFANTNVDIDNDGGSLDAHNWSASLYGTYYATDNFYLEGSATYGWDSYDQDRNIAYSLLDGSRTATADFDGSQYSLLFGAGYDLIAGGSIFDFYGRLRYTSASLEDYRERGASGLDLVIKGQDAISFKSILGIQLTRSISTAKAVLVPQGWVEWEHEFENGDDEVEGYFVNDPNRIPFALPTERFDSDAFRIGLGLGAQFVNGRTAFISYQFSAGLNEYSDHNVTAGVRMEF